MRARLIGQRPVDIDIPTISALIAHASRVTDTLERHHIIYDHLPSDFIALDLIVPH